jgi:hypothetical protein
MPVVLDVHQPKFRSMREQRPLRRNLGSTLARHANLYNSFSTVTQRWHPDNHLTRNDDCYTQTVEAKIDAWVNVGLPRDIAWDRGTVHIAILKEHKPSIVLFTGYQGLV